MTRTPTPTAPRAVSLYLYRNGDTSAEVIGSFAARLVPNAEHDSAAWAITHGLGSIAGGTYTEVVFVDEPENPEDRLPERYAEEVVRQLANASYGRSWAFHYPPARVADAVLAYGSILRERVEVTSVEVWQ